MKAFDDTLGNLTTITEVFLVLPVWLYIEPGQAMDNPSVVKLSRLRQDLRVSTRGYFSKHGGGELLRAIVCGHQGGRPW